SNHSRFDVFARLHHGGDHAAAASALRKLGFGGSKSRPAPTNEAPGPPPQQSPRGDGDDPQREFHTTDRGHAERVIDRHGADLRFCVPFKSWYAWDGRCWAEDATHEATWRIKETQRSLFQWATKKLQALGEIGDDEEKQKQAAKFMAVVK